VTRYIKSGTVNTVQEINSELERIQAAQVDFLTRDGQAPNAMNAPLDMNSQRMLNLPPPASPTDPVRSIDLPNFIAEDNTLLLITREESIVLTAGQTVVTLTELTTTQTAYYVSGQSVDQGRLISNTDYAVTSTTQITLTESYPVGTRLTAVQNEGVEALVSDIQTFNDIAEMKQATLGAGDTALCKRYYDSGAFIEGLLFVIQPVGYVPDGFIDHGLANGTSAKLIRSSTISAYQAGAVGDAVVDDTLALLGALNSDAMKVNLEDGNYRTTAPLVIPSGKHLDLGTCRIDAYFDNGAIIECERNPTLRPAFYVTGNGALIQGGGAFSFNETLNGLLVESSSFCEFGGFNISGVNHPILIAPTGNRDCINNRYYNIDTNANEGLKILAGLIDGVLYRNTTVGTFEDIFFTASGTNGQADAANSLDIITNGSGSVFGLTFDRCSFNPVNLNGGSYVRLYNNPAGTGNSINTIFFNNCEGELRYTAAGAPTIPAIDLTGVFLSSFEIRCYFDEAAGIKLVDSSNNSFSNMQDSIIIDSTALFIDIDATSRDNVFKNVGPLPTLLSTEEGFGNAPQARYYWKRISDNGTNNTFEGILSSYLKRVFQTDYLDCVDGSGNLTNPLFAGFESTTSWTKNADSFTVVSDDNNGFAFDLPASVPINQEMVFRFKYRFIGDLTSIPDNWRLLTSESGTQRAVNMEVTNTITEFMYRTEVTDRGCRVFAPVSSPAVTIEIFALEVFLGGFPYTPNYLATEIYEDSFYKNPTGTWVPEIADASTGGNVSSGTYNGYYSKNGNNVTITVSCVNIITTGLTAGNDIFIRGLPYPPLTAAGVLLNFTGVVSSEELTYATAGGGATITSEILDGTDYIKLAEQQSGAGKDYITVNQAVSGSTDIYFTMSYLTGD
jgi:hypothetical protein